MTCEELCWTELTQLVLFKPGVKYVLRATDKLPVRLDDIQRSQSFVSHKLV